MILNKQKELPLEFEQQAMGLLNALEQKSGTEIVGRSARYFTLDDSKIVIGFIAKGIAVLPWNDDVEKLMQLLVVTNLIDANRTSEPLEGPLRQVIVQRSNIPAVINTINQHSFE